MTSLAIIPALTWQKLQSLRKPETFDFHLMMKLDRRKPLQTIHAGGSGSAAPLHVRVCSLDRVLRSLIGRSLKVWLLCLGVVDGNVTLKWRPGHSSDLSNRPRCGPAEAQSKGYCAAGSKATQTPAGVRECSCFRFCTEPIDTISSFWRASCGLWTPPFPFL